MNEEIISNNDEKIEDNKNEETLKNHNTTTIEEEVNEKLETKGLKLKRKTKNRLNQLQSKFDDAETMVEALLDQYEMFKITEGNKYADRKAEIDKFTYLLDSIKSSYINSLEMASFLEEKQIEKSMMEIKNREKSILRLQNGLTKKEEFISKLEESLKSKDEELKTVKDSFSRVNLALTTVEKELAEKNNIIKNNQMYINSLNELVEEGKKDKQQFEEYKNKFENLINETNDYSLLKERYSLVLNELERNKEEIENIKAELRDSRTYANMLNEKIYTILEEKSKEISKLKDDYAKENIVNEKQLKDEINEKNKQIESLKEEIFQLKLNTK